MSEKVVSSFEGRDGEECEDFVAAVSQQMFAEGKDKDDEYVARFAASKMTRKALRWFVSLDHDVQDSWRLLRAALLKRYCSSDDEEHPNASRVPVPAAAPAMGYRPFSEVPIHTTTSDDIANIPVVPPKHTARSSSEITQSPQSRRGHLRISTNEEVYWLSNELHRTDGFFFLKEDREDALELDVQPALNGRNLIRLPGSTGYSYLGFVCRLPQPLGLTRVNAAVCCAIGTSNSPTETSCLYIYQDRENSKDVWAVSPDGSVQVIWKGDPKLVIRLSYVRENAFLYIARPHQFLPRGLEEALSPDKAATLQMEWI